MITLMKPTIQEHHNNEKGGTKTPNIPYPRTQNQRNKTKVKKWK